MTDTTAPEPADSATTRIQTIAGSARPEQYLALVSEWIQGSAIDRPLDDFQEDVMKALDYLTTAFTIIATYGQRQARSEADPANSTEATE